MNLKIISSSSRGNAYILEGKKQSLLIECGVAWKYIQTALEWNISKVVGCLVSHAHLDHCCSSYQVMNAGIDLYTSQGTAETFKTLHHRLKVMEPMKKVTIGEFKVLPFLVEHDAPEPFGFLISHPESGLTLFVTDTIYTKHIFSGVHNYIIEANYDLEIIDDNIALGLSNKFVRDRVIASHTSLSTCKDFLSKCDLAEARQIVLIHLSDDNADPTRFKREVQQLTGRPVYIAHPGLTIPL